MRPIFRLLICIALLWVCVGVRPVTAEDVDVADCFKTDLAAGARFAPCRTAAEQGDMIAQFNLGFMYAQGLGVSKDYSEAMVWWRRAAEQGEATAQYNLGIMYHNGQGVPQDYAEAVKWWRRAAEQGEASAQNNLGVVYYNGEGVTQDYTLAHMWFNLAGAGCLEEARGTRDTVAKLMTPVQIAEAQRLAREWTAAHRTRTK